MQSPISFLVELVLDCDLPEEAKKRCRKYIKELSDTNDGNSVYTPKRQVKPITSVTAQAPSTQRILDEMAAEGHALTAPIAKPLAVQRIVGGEVNTGNGTRGPRKF